MIRSTKELTQEIKNIFVTLKLLVLLLCVIPIIQRIFARTSTDEMLFLSFSKMLLFVSVILIVVVFWVVTNYAFKNQRVRSIVEVVTMYCFCFLCYRSTGTHLSSYKFIFALIILLYTMELGLRFGTILSATSGAIIIVCDYVSCEEALRSQYFQADLMLLGTFALLAYIVGFYVEKDRAVINSLKESVNKDALTKLYNHRYFHEYMHEIINRPHTEGGREYLFIMDIDFFKVYNDTHGHLKGDVVLAKIAEISQKTITTGFVFRYGGEEFAMHLFARDAHHAFDIANKLRIAIADYVFEGEELMPGHNVTVSIGVSEKREEDDTVADWIERADNALYKAKAFRKNCVQFYSSVFDRFDHLDQINDDERIISIKTLLSVINSRDRYTYNHTDRVVHYCEIFSKYAKLSEDQSRKLLYSAYLHDIGKINIPQEILISEKRLSNEEWALMKKHPWDGADIVRKIENFETIADIVQQHHEKYNGTGYPQGIKGEDIHYLARILTLADSFDAMTAKRPYQKVKTFEEAFEEIRKCKGTHFDPELAEIFVNAIEDTYG